MFFHGSLGHTTGSLGHTILQSNFLFNVMAQEHCEYTEAVSGPPIMTAPVYSQCLLKVAFVQPSRNGGSGSIDRSSD